MLVIIITIITSIIMLLLIIIVISIYCYTCLIIYNTDAEYIIYTCYRNIISMCKSKRRFD